MATDENSVKGIIKIALFCYKIWLDNLTFCDSQSDMPSGSKHLIKTDISQPKQMMKEQYTGTINLYLSTVCISCCRSIVSRPIHVLVLCVHWLCVHCALALEYYCLVGAVV